jgi:hypothetical protein
VFVCGYAISWRRLPENRPFVKSEMREDGTPRLPHLLQLLTAGAGPDSALSLLCSSLPDCAIFASTGTSLESVGVGTDAIGVTLSFMMNLLVGQ